MSQYDEFLKKQKLFRCAPLEAVISAPTCSTNRKSGNIFACEKCTGLGAVVEIKVVEEAPVGKKMCGVAGCDKIVHARGMCWAHERSELGINPATGKKIEADKPKAWAAPFVPAAVEPVAVDIIDESGWVQPVMVAADSFGQVVIGDGEAVPSGTDEVVVLALREAWLTKEREWLADLSGLKPGRTIMLAVQMVNAVEGLGY